MKKIISLVFVVFCLLSCKENDNILMYDADNSYVYFAYPNPDRRAVEKFADSIFYSFSMDEDLQITQKTMHIPVKIGGGAVNIDRNYTYVIDPASDYDPAIVEISEPKIPAGDFGNTLSVRINRDAKLLTKQMTLILEIVPNDHFQVGNVYNRKIKIVFSDILNEPAWWNTWRNYFGTFHREVFQKWMQVYYLGADPSPDLSDGTPGPVYYWNNMPSSAIASWYPVTFSYIEVLKQYFLQNEVYPGGDTTKDRILLP